MDETGAVEQDVKGPQFVGERGDRLPIGDIEPARRDKGFRQVGDLVLGNVGGQDAGALGGEGQRRRPTDSLRRRRDQGALAFEPPRHGAAPRRCSRQNATAEEPL